METQAAPGDWIQRQATSRPWYTERTKTDSAITSADGINIGHMNKEVCAQDCVRAVNQHDALVEALEKAIKFIDDEVGGYDIEAEEAIGARAALDAVKEAS